MENAIVAVCKDPGGANGLLPVVEELRMRGYLVALRMDGFASTFEPALKAGGIPVAGTDDVLRVFPTPCAFLTDMSSSGGGVGRDLIPSYRGKCPTIAFQDFWGVPLTTDWASPAFRPDRIVVNDRFGAELVRKAWPEMESDRIWVTGFPAWDKYAAVDMSAARAKLRSALGLTEAWPFILYGGDCVPEVTATMLEEVVSAIHDTDIPVYFHPRPHPRMDRDAPDERQKWDAAVSRFSTGVLVTLPTLPVTFQELIAGSDVVIANMSTILTEKAILGGTAVSVLYPDTGAKLLAQTTGGMLVNYPLSRLGCVEEAHTHEELCRIMRAACTDGLAHLLEHQKRELPVSGDNAARAADRIVRLI